MKDEVIIAVTGHRPDKLWGYKKDRRYEILQDIIERTLVAFQKSRNGIALKCMSGMALGADMIFAKAVIALKEKGANVSLCAIVPCLNQDKQWHEDDKIVYKEILEKADEKVVVTNREYVPGCMLVRNKYMIDRCDYLIAVYNGDKSGGTADTVRQLRRTNKPMVRIDPTVINNRYEEMIKE